MYVKHEASKLKNHLHVCKGINYGWKLITIACRDKYVKQENQESNHKNMQQYLVCCAVVQCQQFIAQWEKLGSLDGHVLDTITRHTHFESWTYVVTASLSYLTTGRSLLSEKGIGDHQMMPELLIIAFSVKATQLKPWNIIWLLVFNRQMRCVADFVVTIRQYTHHTQLL